MTPGEIIGRRYRLKERLAKGGMAEVWIAIEDGTNVEVVVKTPRTAAMQRRDLLQMFEREGTLLSRVTSPYVARFYGYFNEGKRPFIVIERLFGETLGDRLKHAHVLTLADLGPMVEHILVALSAAHDAGVLHRDLSPDNVFLCGKPEIAKLIDFGVGKLMDGEPMTPADATLGSFAYMAPEQWLDPSKVDARTDLYALGTIVFRALTGTLPFPEKNAIRLLTLKRDFDAPTIGEATRAPYPTSVSHFVETALARNREDRFPTAFAMLGAWRGVFAASGWTAPTITLGGTPEDGGDTTATMTRQPKRKV
ncbi:MAG TPA: serine/threonine-protein kinase [Polyangiaceae bacterium]|jgi:serine/threonine-protein kinase|nr:serine/threonine-protein kinase [Polyangiaceae bacterium]